MLDAELRTAIEADVRQMVYRLPNFNEPERQCLHWAFAAAHIMDTRYGLRSCVNAGSADFWAVDHQHDDGVSPTTFSYHWQEAEDFDSLFEIPHLPEMHAWAVVPDQNLIVDFTTGFLPQLTKENKIIWSRPMPPDVLWCDAADPPHGFNYKPHVQACEFAYRTLENLLKRYR